MRFIALCLLILSPAPLAHAEYADINGIKLYYETHGPRSGTPLLMIHGGGSTIDSAFSKLLPMLAKERPVIAMEEQNHGRSGGRPGPVSFKQTAEDAAALLKKLKIEKADVLGFSNGASTAMQIAINYPSLVNKLVYISSFTKKSGAAPGFWEMFKKGDGKCMMPEPLRKAFLKVNNNPAALEEMCEKDTARMKNFTETPDSDVKKIAAPTLVLLGDQDVVTVEHGAEVARLIPGAELAVLPGKHGEFFDDAAFPTGNPRMPEVTAKLILAFLSAKPAK